MKHIMLLFIFAAIAVQTIVAQNTGKPVVGADTANQHQNAVYANIGGVAFFGATLNYERSFSKKPGGLSATAGFGIGTIPGLGENDDATLKVLPVGLSYNLPASANKRNFIELGALYTFVFIKDDNGQVVSPIAGWKYESASGRLQLRATLLLFVYSPTDHSSGAVPWISFGIGTKF